MISRLGKYFETGSGFLNPRWLPFQWWRDEQNRFTRSWDTAVWKSSIYLYLCKNTKEFKKCQNWHSYSISFIFSQIIRWWKLESENVYFFFKKRAKGYPLVLFEGQKFSSELASLKLVQKYTNWQNSNFFEKF